MQIEHRQGTMSSADGLELAWRSWVPSVPIGVMTIVHGLAEHAGRYRETAEAFCTAGWAVYAVDLRAHGLSANPPGAGRVHVNRFEDYFLDVDAINQRARNNHPDLPHILLGHSMGGLISIRYALEKPAGLCGVVISSPALEPHPESRPSRILKLLVAILSRLAPRFRVASDLDTQAISRDAKVVQAYLDDPLVSSKVSARWYTELLSSMAKAHDRAPSLSLPMLLMQSGADRLVDPQAPGRWLNAAPPGRVELVVWDGLYHEMFNEPEKETVRDRVLEWLGSVARS